MALRDLLETRATTVSAMRAITDHPAGDGGDLSDQQAADFDKHKASLERTEAAIGRQQAVDDAERRMAAPAIVHGNGRDGQYEERARSFSVVKMINASLGEPIDVGFEREISSEVRTRSGRRFMGIPVPDQYFEVERRVVTTGSSESPGAAQDLYPTVHRPDLFIDLLRSSLVTGRLGATILSNLVGDQDIPRQSAAGSAEWLAEEGALTPSDASFDDVTLSPHTVGSVTSYSRRTLLNASPSIEQIVRADLAAVMARAIDAAALFGDGQSNVPLGVASQSNIATPSMSTPNWAEVLGVISAIQTSDADLGGLAWTMGPGAVAKLRGTNKTASEPEHGYLMETPAALAGYPVVPSTAIQDTFSGSPASLASRTVLFGSWSQLLIGYWGSFDLLVNPFEAAAYLRGRVWLRALRDVDTSVRHVESFAYVDDLPA